MKKALLLSIFAFCRFAAFAQTGPGSIPPMFSQMKGDLIRETYSFRCFFPIPAKGQDKVLDISMGVFHSNRVRLSHQDARRLPAVARFMKDTVFLHQRNRAFAHAFASVAGVSFSIQPFLMSDHDPDAPVPVFDSTAVVVILNGVGPSNAGKYEFRVLKNKTEELLSWRDIRSFIPPYLKPPHKANTQPVNAAAFLGQFRVAFGNSLTIDVREKERARSCCLRRRSG